MSKSGQSRHRDSGTIIRVDKAAGRWEAVPLSLLEDTRLSFDTRGFTAWLLARPPGWEIRAGALPYLLKDNSSCGHVGRDKARRFLRELEQAGYLTGTRTRDPNGYWIWRSVFPAVSPTIDGLAVGGSAVDGSSTDGKGVDINHTPITTDGFNSNAINLQASAQDVSAGQAGVGLDNKIQIPKILGGEYLTSAQTLLKTCPPEQRQAVLDEVAAVHHRAALRGSPIGLLHSLVQRAKAGTFIPSYAIPYREKQRREARERELLLERRSRSPTTGPVPVGTIAHQTLARLSALRKDQEK